MNETVKIWLEELDNLTSEKIMVEIEEVKSAINNERLWALGTPENNDHEANIETLEEYLEELKNLLKDCEHTSSFNGDYSPSDPWNAPGMSMKDFI